MPDRPTTRTDPLLGTDRLLVDGTNLLHVLLRRDGPAPQATLIGRLRGVIPASIGIELVFDGSPDPGLRGERIASGLIVRHSGRRSGDELLLSLVDGARGSAGPEAGAGILVVTDDHDLGVRLRAKGARTVRAAWLLGRLDRPRLAAPSVGNRRPPPPPGHPERDDGPGRSGWKPGRGATAKRGNPRRGRPSSGSMRP
jgi:hypothetical protein